MKNKSSNFVAVSDQETNIKIVSGYFYIPLVAIVCKDIGYSNLCSCYNLVIVSWSKKQRRIAFLITLIFHRTMTKKVKSESKSNNSTLTLPSAHETGNLLVQLEFAQTNNSLLPTKIRHETSGEKSTIKGDINDQGISNVEGSGVVGNNTAGSNNNIQSVTQNNEHGKNIYAQTVTINEFPKELEILLEKILLKLKTI